MLDRLNAQHELELRVGERESLEVSADELGSNARLGGGRGRRQENALGDVDADHPVGHGTELRERREVPPVPATRIEERADRQEAAKLLGDHRELPVDGRVGRERLRVLEAAAQLVDVAQLVRWRRRAHPAVERNAIARGRRPAGRG